MNERNRHAGALAAGGVALLTGATGALGSWIAHRALADGIAVRALARLAGGLSARQRVEQSIVVAAGQPVSSRLEIIDGDLLDDRIEFGFISCIIHCAACTSFHDHSAQDSRRTNVEGLQRMLDIARQQKVPFVHVSTAYVCGDRSGRVCESELDVGQRFHNVYERTKCEGEALVHRWSAETGLPAIVLRPSIVLGDWANGRAVRFNTLYHLLRTLDAFGPSLRGQRLRLVGRPDVTKNIIPVDYFAKVAWQIIRQGTPGSYHIVHREPIRMGELSQIFSELFDIDLQLVSEADFSRERGTAIERTCHRIMAPYRAYMTQPEPDFDQRATRAVLGSNVAGPPRMDAAYFRRLLTYARKVTWGRQEADAPDRAMPVDPVCKYFEVFLAQRVDQSLLPDLKRLSARVSIAMKDRPGSNWWLDLREGVLKAISRDSSAEDCSFTLNSSTFLEIAAGRLAPQRAFFTGRVRIGGNLELGLKVATVLAKFFSDYPFVAEPN